jgi:hypothetical protein
LHFTGSITTETYGIYYRKFSTILEVKGYNTKKSLSDKLIALIAIFSGVNDYEFVIWQPESDNFHVFLAYCGI